jgi:hypothetical protein
LPFGQRSGTGLAGVALGERPRDGPAVGGAEEAFKLPDGVGTAVSACRWLPR